MPITTRQLFLCQAIVAACSFVASASFAQSSAQDGEFSAQRFQPALGPRNFVTVNSVRSDGKMTWSGGLFINYGHKPFVVKSCRSAGDCNSANNVNQSDVNVISSMITGDFMGTLTPIPRLQLGLRVPVTYVKGDGFNAETGQASQSGLSATGLGDPMIEAKFRAIGNTIKDPINAGAAFFATFPTGHATAKNSYIGDAGPGVYGLKGIVDVLAGPFTAGANLSGLYRKESTLGSTQLGPEMRYGAAAGFQVSPVFRILAEVYGSTKFSSKNGTNTMESLLGAQISPIASNINLYLGAGPGILSGVGVPQFRGFVGFMYVREVSDSDGDGIPDNKDQCPNEPEDKDGYHDDDGCPDDDNDGDGIKDKADKCPNDPETLNGINDQDGCPDEVPDTDKDGIPDNLDKCPTEGGPKIITKEGPNYGCPDTDGDTIPDKLDKCPDKAEDFDGFEDKDGCPEPGSPANPIPTAKLRKREVSVHPSSSEASLFFLQFRSTILLNDIQNIQKRLSQGPCWVGKNTVALKLTRGLPWNQMNMETKLSWHG
jgi:OmpA-OmpF porin, OOP family